MQRLANLRTEHIKGLIPIATLDDNFHLRPVLIVIGQWR
jgi:hypothetical protein